MALLEANTRVFIVRIWFETREIKDAPPAWRGMIEHVPTGKRRYFADLSDLTAFIESFVEDLNVSSECSDR
jgi:hypothetical protein